MSLAEARDESGEMIELRRTFKQVQQERDIRRSVLHPALKLDRSG